jgi:hypothetical protein
MRITTITLLLIITIIFSACASQPQAEPKAKQQDSCCISTTTEVDKKTGARKVTTEKHYGPIPDCTEPVTYTPCYGKVKPRPAGQPTGEPRKLTPADQAQSLKPGR